MLPYYENRAVPFVGYSGVNMTFHPHLHKQVELLYVLDGEIQVDINNVHKIMHAGELAIAFPNTIHSYLTETACHYIMLIFDVELCSDFSGYFSKYLAPMPFLECEEVNKDVIFCMEAFQRYSGQTPDLKLIKGYLLITLSHIFDTMPLTTDQHNDSLDLTHRTLVYLTKHFKEPLSLSIVAQQLGASKYQVSRVFSNKIGTGFNDYLNSLRIEFACHLLSSSRLSITEISFECGFESQRTFYRAFKDIYRITPAEYRRQESTVSP